MSYDYGRKYISKKTGLTGIEAGNIAKSLSKKGLDFQSVDWETIGSDLYGHGKRTGGVKHHLGQMYGINIDIPSNDPFEYVGQQSSLQGLMTFHERRSKRSRRTDLSRNAKRRFKPSNAKGVKKWKKHPNRYDIIGIDDIV